MFPVWGVVLGTTKEPCANQGLCRNRDPPEVESRKTSKTLQIPSRKMIERQITDILAYPQTPSAKIAEITSAIAESQREPDIYFYNLRDGKLFSPTHHIPVIDSTTSPQDRNLIEQMESWAKNNQVGTAIWISPPTEAGETSVKITILEIVGEVRKMVKNTSVLVVLFLEDIQRTKYYTLSFSINPLEDLTPKEARYKLIILRDRAIPPEVASFFKGGWEEQKERIRKAVEIAKASRKNHDLAGIIFANYAGSFPLSCPTVGVGTIYNKSSEIGARFLECTCPFCHLKVRAKIEAGKIYCPVCQRSADYHC